jgi:hypothetical protein
MDMMNLVESFHLTRLIRVPSQSDAGVVEQSV